MPTAYRSAGANDETDESSSQTSIPHERSPSRADSLAVAMLVDVASDLSQKLSSSSTSLSQIINGMVINSQEKAQYQETSTEDLIVNPEESDSDEGEVACAQRSSRSPARICELNDFGVEGATSTPLKRLSRSPEYSPVRQSDHDYTAPKKRYRKKKNSSPRSPLRATKSSPRRPVRARKQKNNFDDIFENFRGAVKRKKSESSAYASSDEENDPHVLEKSAGHCDKKRKLYTRSDSLQDTVDFVLAHENKPLPKITFDSRDEGIDSPKSSDVSEETEELVINSPARPPSPEYDPPEGYDQMAQSFEVDGDEAMHEDAPVELDDTEEEYEDVEMLEEDFAEQFDAFENVAPPQEQVYVLSDDEEMQEEPGGSPLQVKTIVYHVSDHTGLLKSSVPATEASKDDSAGSRGDSPPPGLADDDDLPEYFEYPTEEYKGWTSEEDEDEVRANASPSQNPGPSFVVEEADERLEDIDEIDFDASPFSEEENYFDEPYYGRRRWGRYGARNSWSRKKTQKKSRARNLNNAAWHDLFTRLSSAARCSDSEDDGLDAKVDAKYIEDLHRAITSKPKPNVRIEGPPGLQVQLMPHQEHALAWMLWRENSTPAGGILADDMGLGKTVMTIALIMTGLRLDAEKPNEEKGGTLIVCPANLISQWQREIQQRGGKEVHDVHVFHGPNRPNSAWTLRCAPVVVTSFDTLTNNWKELTTGDGNAVLFRVHWRRVILDEAHVIRNHKTKRSECAAELIADYRWALTGTPIHNRIKDLFALTKFLKLKPIDESKNFNQFVDTASGDGKKRLQSLTNAVMLRRTKDELMAAGLMPGLPPQTKEVIKIDLTEEERSVYENLMNHSTSLFERFLVQQKQRRGIPTWQSELRTLGLTARQRNAPDGKVQQAHILTLILRLRQLCCHPALILSVLDKEDLTEAGVDKKDVDGALKKSLSFLQDEDNPLKRDNPIFKKQHVSTKITAVIDRVRRIVATGEKVIIVSDFVKYLEIVAAHLENLPAEPRVVFHYYTGADTKNARDTTVEEFNTQKYPNVLLLSLKAGGQGLNLMAANHVIIMDIHWNPQLEIQAQDRVYRIGQKRNVFVHKFVCSDTIEERIVALQESKLKIADEVLSGARVDVRLGIDDLCTLFNVRR